MTTPKAFLALVVPLVVGCATGPGQPRSELSAALARWNSQQAVSYQITIHRLCECEGTDPVRVTVVNGQVTSRIDLTTGLPVPSALEPNFTDVPGLFALVQDAYERAHSVAVTFNAVYGYPQTANIDYIGNAIDDELSLTVDDFVKQ